MKLNTTDREKISRHKCQIRKCQNKSYGMTRSKFLCEEHYRDEIPQKSTNYYRTWKEMFRKVNG